MIAEAPWADLSFPLLKNPLFCPRLARHDSSLVADQGAGSLAGEGDLWSGY